jgi:hypothetical protein
VGVVLRCAALLLFAAACADRKGHKSQEVAESASARLPSVAISGSHDAQQTAQQSAQQSAQQEEKAAACAAAIDETLKQPPAPGVPAFEAAREEILARAKARPVLFLRAPEPTPPTPEARSARSAFERVSTSALSMYSAYRQLVPNARIAREVFLREGYLFADTVQVAMGLANVVKLEDLFDEAKIWIHRGAEILEVARHIEAGEPIYRYANGAEQGQRATILFLDRVATDPSQLATPLHRDFSVLQTQLGFDAVRIEQLTEAKMVAQLKYGDVWVRSLLRTGKDAALDLECELPNPEQAVQIAQGRINNQQLWRAMAEIRRVIAVQMEESLPFDEPKTEFGQEDGKLRQAWSWAYRFGRSHFEYNDDRYRVFDASGRPRVPQVCIDFITDTLERASGTWYRNRGEPRERIRGRLDFNDFGIENRRSVESLVGFAEQNPNWFTVTHLPAQERVAFQLRGQFYDYLKQHRTQFRVGNVVTILGLRDDGKEHYHSFFVYDVDPVTQMPIWLASNAGRPRIRVWENEMGNAPKRSIKSVIEPKLQWLVEKVLGQ